MGDFERIAAMQARLMNASALGIGDPAGIGVGRRGTTAELAQALGLGGAAGLPTAGARPAGGFADVLASLLAPTGASGPGVLDSLMKGLGTVTRSRFGSEGSAGGIPRVVQADPNEYDSSAQAKTWSGSTCSAAALCAVLRSKGVPVRIADVMAAMPGGLTPQLGLVSRPALMGAAARYGVELRDDVTTYAELQRAVATGQPALVDVTNARFPEGHWMVVTGVTDQGVELVDSSGYALRSMSKEELLASWRGRAMRVVDRKAP